VPELGTLTARERPVVILTSNQRRELSEALRRRCLHLHLDFPGVEKEREILALKVPDLDETLRARVAEFVGQLRRLDLKKAPSIAETLDWARALVALGIRELDGESVRRTLAVLLKHEDDVRKAEPKIAGLKRESR
jgi:MoxR-like ATPase